jgi:hypothetical protein
MLKRILAGLTGKVRRPSQGADLATVPPQNLHLATLLSMPDDVFAQAIKQGIQELPPISHVMILVGYANAKPIYEVAKQAAKKRGELEVFLKSLLSGSDWPQDEINQRKYGWYFYGFSLLQLADRAIENSKLNILLADIWFILTSAAERIDIKNAIGANIIWKPDEKQWFTTVKNETDGIRFIVNHLVPKEYRGDPRIKRLLQINEDRAEREKLDAAQGYPSVKPEYVDSVKGWRLAAARGDAMAQRNLGTAYFKGHGVSSNEAEAAKWFHLAAEQGDATAQEWLGSMYAHGWGVPQNTSEAVKWWRLAAEQGNAEAQWNFGKLYVYYDAGGLSRCPR